ncbi:MAG TPA: GNAT family N-acetyltransferase [Thermoanaerobaculia bacterium]
MIPSLELLGVQYGMAEPSDMDELAALLGLVFSRSDPPAVALGVTAAEFESVVRLYGPRAAAEGLTIVARSVDTGEMAGALLTEDASSAPPSGIERLSSKFDPVFDMLGQLDADYRRGRSVPPGEWLHLSLLGVAQPFGGRGVGQQLVASCLENGARKGYRLAVTEATSSASQHIFRKHGFVERVRRSYRDYRYHGEAVFASIEGPAGPILMDRDLNPPRGGSPE